MAPSCLIKHTKYLRELIKVRKNLFQRHDLDISEPDSLCFGLEGDVAVSKFAVSAFGEQRFGFFAVGVQLWFGVAQNFFAANVIDDFFVATDFDFDRNPLVGR